jgi:hypothetical protein
MARTVNYTPEERTMLLLAPFEAGIAVLLSSKSGMIGTAQEALALYHSFNKDVAKQYPHNALIQDLLTGDNREAHSQMNQKAEMYIKNEAARKQAKPEALQMCRNVAALLAHKSPPQEAEEYKKWVMDVSAKVANAASEEGQKVSPAEQATMNEIAQAINTTPSSAS